MDKCKPKQNWKDIQPDPETGKTDTSFITPKIMQQAIKDNQQDLEKAKRAKKPYCNYYERQKDLERGLFTPNNETADQRYDRMNKDQANWEKIPRLDKKDKNGNIVSKLDHHAAHQAAKEGNIVKIVYKSSGKKDDEHGHIAEVDGSKLMEKSDAWGKTLLPFIDGYDANKNAVLNEKLSWQFSPSREKNMDYFIYRGDFIPLK